MQAVESSSDGLVKIGPAPLYGTLKRLVDGGLAVEVVRPLSQGEDARRRYDKRPTSAVACVLPKPNVSQRSSPSRAPSSSQA
jgi:hypothetical protein